MTRRQWMRGLRRPIVLGFYLSTATWLSACGVGIERDVSDSAEPLPVTTTLVSETDHATAIDVGGLVQARVTAMVTARIVAPVREVRVAPGDRVTAGQLLVVLEDQDLVATERAARLNAEAVAHQVTAAAAEAAAAQAALVLAQASFDRISTLVASRSATPAELDQVTASLRASEARTQAARAAQNAAESTVASARASGEAAAVTAAFARVTAPFAGVVAEKFVEPGNTATPGMPLVRIEDTSGFRLELRVDASRVSALPHGSKVPVVLDATDGPLTIEGTVTEISRAVDAGARSVLVKLALPTHAGLRSGLFGRALVPGEVRAGLSVPEAAVVRHGQVSSVFVVTDDVARLRMVDVRGTDVLSGLAAGERVIVSPPPDLVDGRRVREGAPR